MPEATRRLLYQLNRRWIYGRLVSAPPPLRMCLCLCVAYAMRSALRILALITRIARHRQSLTGCLVAAPAHDRLLAPDHGCLTHRPQVQWLLRPAPGPYHHDHQRGMCPRRPKHIAYRKASTSHRYENITDPLIDPGWYRRHSSPDLDCRPRAFCPQRHRQGRLPRHRDPRPRPPQPVARP